MKKIVFPLQQDLKIKIANDGYTLYPSDEFGLTYRLSNIDMVNKTMLLEIWVVDMSNLQIVRKVVDYYVTKDGYNSKYALNQDELDTFKNEMGNLTEKRRRLESMLQSVMDSNQDGAEIQKKLDELNLKISNMVLPEPKYKKWFLFDEVVEYFDKFVLTDEGLIRIYNLEFNGNYIGDYIAKRV